MAKVTKKLFSNQYYYVNDAGEKFGPYDSVRLDEFGNSDYVWVYQNGKCGMLDADGKQVVPCEYDFVQTPINGYFIVQNEIDGTTKALYGIVDPEGKLVVPVKYDDLYIKNHHIAQSGDGFYCLCISGEYDECKPYGEDYFIVSQDGKWGLIDKNGNQVLACEYDEIKPVSLGTLSNPYRVDEKGKVGLALRKGNGWGMASRHGKVIVPCKYKEEPQIFKNFVGLSSGGYKGPHTLFTMNGNQISSTKYYVEAHYIDSGEVVVSVKDPKNEKRELYGLLDKDGNEILPCMSFSMPVAINERFFDVGGKIFDTKTYTLGEQSYGPIYEENGYIICQEIKHKHDEEPMYTVIDGKEGNIVDRVDEEGLCRFRKPIDKGL